MNDLQQSDMQTEMTALRRQKMTQRENGNDEERTMSAELKCVIVCQREEERSDCKNTRFK